MRKHLMSEFPTARIVRLMPQITIDGEPLGGVNELPKLARTVTRADRQRRPAAMGESQVPDTARG